MGSVAVGCGVMVAVTAVVGVTAGSGVPIGVDGVDGVVLGVGVNSGVSPEGVGVMGGCVGVAGGSVGRGVREGRGVFVGWVGQFTSIFAPMLSSAYRVRRPLVVVVILP